MIKMYKTIQTFYSVLIILMLSFGFSQIAEAQIFREQTPKLPPLKINQAATVNKTGGSGNTVLAAGCNNIDFESGNFTNWTGFEGYNENTTQPLTQAGGTLNPPPTNLNNAETSCQYYAIIANGSTDPNMGIVLTSPLGGNCARMGGENRNLGDANTACPGNGGGNSTYTVPTQCEATYFGANIGDQLLLAGSAGEVLQTTFTVTPQNTAFQYAYLFAYTDNGSHDTTQQPYFKVRVLDQNGQEINCLNYFQQGLGDACGNTHAPPGYSGSLATGLFYTSNWQVSSLNLLPYLNQPVTVIFTVAGCTVGGHFGYAYVDCACAPQQIIIPNTACVGANTQLIAPPLGNAVFQWSTANGNIVSGTNTTTVTVNQSGTYSVTITPTKTTVDASGNLVTHTLTSCSYELDTTITLYPNPTVSVNSGTICTGGTTTLNVTSTGDAGALTYTWSSTAGLTFSPGDSVANASPPSTTIYTITGTTIHGCHDTAVSNVTVNGSAPPSFNAPTVCLGAATVFTSTVAAAVYSWNFGDLTTLADTSHIQNPTYTYTASGNYAVNFSVTTAAGCKSNTTQTVTVNPVPTASFSASPVCLGAATVFTSTINPTAGSTYMWDYGDPAGNPVAGTATPTHTYGTANTFPVTLTVTAAGGCTVTATNSVVVNPLPTPAFNVPAVCLGTGSVFNNTSTGDSACAWNFGGAGNPATANSICAPTFTYSAAGTFPVTLTVTATGGCKATITGNAVVNPMPVMSFNTVPACDQAPICINNTTANQGSFNSWNWDFGDGSPANTTATPGCHTYAAAGIYTVVLTATTSTGCSGTVTATAIVHPNPIANGGVSPACQGDGTSFVDASIVTNPTGINDAITSWTWNYGDGHSSTQPSPTYTYATCGVYSISLTVSTNFTCTNTISGTDTVFCLPVVTAPPSFSICPATPVTSAQTTFSTTCAAPAWGVPASVIFVNNPNPRNNTTTTHGGIPLADTVDINSIPNYTAINPNLTCGLLVDTIYGYAVTIVGNNVACIGNVQTFTISVYPTPTVTPISSVTVCPNVTVPAFNFTGCPGTPTETYSWTTSGNNVGIATASPGLAISTFTSQNTTDLVAVETVSVTPLANGCSGPATTFSVSVNPIPTMTVTSPAPYCPGDLISSTDYTITTDPAAAGVTYTWTATPNIGMPLTGTGAAPNTPYNAPANATLANIVGSVTYTPSLAGCIGLPVTETVTIKPTPIVDPVPASFYCPNEVTNAINFTCQPAGGTPVFTYTVPGGFGQTGTGSVPSYTTINTGTTNLVTTFTVNATLNNCKGPNSTFSVTVHPNPVASFSYKPKVCIGSPMNFTDASVAYGGYAINSWSWDMFNNGSIESTAQNPQYLIPTVGLDSVKLTVGTSSAPSCTAQVTEAVFVNPKPVPDFIGVNLHGCPHPTLQTAFTDQSTPVGQIASWSWDFGIQGQAPVVSQFPPPQNYTNQSHIFPQDYTVSLTITSDSGCMASKIKGNYVEVYPIPVADFSWGPGDADIDAPKITFVNDAIGANTYTPTLTYGQYGVQYYLGDTYAANTTPNYVYNNTTFSHNYSDPDPNDVVETYYVTQSVINSYGCTDSITKPVEIQPIFTFYIPNAFTPNGDRKNEGFKGLGIGIDNTTYNLWVFDRWGLMIYHANDIDKAWDGHMLGHEDKPILQEDVYVWKVKFNDIFGKLHEYHGTVTLVK